MSESLKKIEEGLATTIEANAKKIYPKPRSCPSCKASIDRLQLSAFSMPIEQFTVPHLLAMNASVGYSIRTHGMTRLNELQFLAFTSTCGECGNISWWDIPTLELEEILAGSPNRPVVNWTSNPDIIKAMLNKLPEANREPFQKLLNDILPKGENV